MRLLFLNHNVAWSGTFFRAYHLGRHFATMGHEVTLVTTHPTNRLRFATTLKDGVTIVYAPDLFWGPGRQGWDPVNVLRRSSLLRAARWDLVHAFDCRPVVVVPARQVARRGAVLIMDWADWWGRGGTIQDRSGWVVRTFFGPVETWFEESFRREADGTTVISTALGDRARALGVPAASILKMPHGCDVDRFGVVDRGLARGRLGLSLSDRVVVHLGRLLPGDGGLLFAAFRQLLDEDAGAKLVLVGAPRASMPIDLVERGAIVRTGFVSYESLQTWLGAADLCVVPLQDTIANRGRWPSKINDCLAAGRPVLITRVGDAAAIVEGAGAGWVAAPDPKAVASAMSIALANPKALEMAGDCARGLAETDLAWSRLAKALEAFYLRVRDSRRRDAPS